MVLAKAHRTGKSARPLQGIDVRVASFLDLPSQFFFSVCVQYNIQKRKSSKKWGRPWNEATFKSKNSNVITYISTKFRTQLGIKERTQATAANHEMHPLLQGKLHLCKISAPAPFEVVGHLKVSIFWKLVLWGLHWIKSSTISLYFVRSCTYLPLSYNKPAGKSWQKRVFGIIPLPGTSASDEQSAHFHDFSLHSVISELRAHAPDIHRLFMTLGGTSHDVTSDDSHPCVEEIRAIASQCTLLKEHSVKVKGILLFAFILS